MERLHIRTATLEDLEQIAAIEAACFPPEQAGSREDIRQRLGAYPDHVLVGEWEGTVAGYIMGPVIAPMYIEDAMFHDIACHRPEGPYQSVFSLAVSPVFQHQGIGGQLLRAMADLARREGRRGGYADLPG